MRFTPADTTERALKWKSSNPSVVAVNEAGEITGVGTGKATITAVAVGGKVARCSVKVEEVEPKDLDFDQMYVTLHLGERYTLKTDLQPEDNSYPALIFKSSDKSVATVDKTTGEVTALKCGSTTITAVCRRDRDISDTCRLIVVKPKAKRLAGLVIGINPGHQSTGNYKKYPLAPGSRKTGNAIGVGACGHWTRVNEYETNLQVGLKLAKRLKKLGATVIITRTSNDVMLTNIERAEMLNAANVDAALQLHCDAVDNSSAHGCSTFYRDNSDWVRESRSLAKALAAAISDVTGCDNRGAKVYNDYMSLNYSQTPAVLIEMGFISNRREDELLASDEYREKMADAIVEGLCRHFGR